MTASEDEAPVKTTLVAFGSNQKGEVEQAEEVCLVSSSALKQMPSNFYADVGEFYALLIRDLWASVSSRSQSLTTQHQELLQYGAD